MLGNEMHRDKSVNWKMKDAEKCKLLLRFFERCRLFELKPRLTQKLPAEMKTVRLFKMPHGAKK